MIFKKGEDAPEWLALGGFKFGVDTLVEEYGAGYRVSPLKPMEREDFLLRTDNPDVPTRPFPKPLFIWRLPVHSGDAETDK